MDWLKGRYTAALRQRRWWAVAFWGSLLVVGFIVVGLVQDRLATKANLAIDQHGEAVMGAFITSLWFPIVAFGAFTLLWAIAFIYFWARTDPSRQSRAALSALGQGQVADIANVEVPQALLPAQIAVRTNFVSYVQAVAEKFKEGSRYTYTDSLPNVLRDLCNEPAISSTLYKTWVMV